MKKVFLYMVILFISQKLWTQESIQLTDSIITFNYSTSTDSVLYTKLESKIDSNGKQSSGVYYKRDLILSEWVGLTKQAYAYDSFGDMILETIFRWDSNTDDWTEYLQQEYVYDSQGSLILDHAFHWDSNLADWEEYLKHELSYDTAGRQTVVAGFTWDINTNDWLRAGRFEVTYNSYENTAISVYYSWDPGLNDWMIIFKSEETFDYLGNKTSRIVYYWNSSSSDWLVSHKLEYTYDSRGNKILETHFDRDTTGDVWLRSYKCELLSDLHGNQMLETHYSWNSKQSEWEVIYKTRYYYDSKYRMESASICSGDSLFWRGEYYHSQGTYYATSSEPGDDSLYKLNLSVYPTPSSFSISGQKAVLENQISVYTSPANPKVNYSWLTQNGDVLSNPSDNSTEIQWDAAGEGVIIGIAENQYQCQSKPSILQVSIGTSDIHDSPDAGFTVYPNPAKDHIYVQIKSLDTRGVYHLRLINRLGTVVFETNVESQLHEISTLPWSEKGLYFVQLNDAWGNNIYTKKIIIR